MFCDKSDQTLWIYTADCMPILFADKSKRFVASIHCGRKGLESKIIKNLINIFDKIGSSRDDIIVAIGPSISKKNYLVDRKTLKDFLIKVDNKELRSPIKNIKEFLNLRDMITFKKEKLIELDLRKYALIQLLKENVPYKNIDISSLCTHKSHNEFHSWRRSKTHLRQWSFICS